MGGFAKGQSIEHSAQNLVARKIICAGIHFYFTLMFCLIQLPVLVTIFSVHLDEVNKMAGESNAPFKQDYQKNLIQVLLRIFPGKYGPSHYGLNVHNLLGNNYLK